MRLIGLCVCSAGLLAQASPFNGRWNLTVTRENGRDSGWLEVTEGSAQPRVRMVGRVGGAKSPERVEVGEGLLRLFTKDWFGRYEPVEYRLRREGEKLTGVVRRENGEDLTVVGLPAPALKREGPVAWGAQVTLIGETDGGFGAWRIEPAGGAANWKIEGGVLINTAKGANIRTLEEFEDFRLHVEFRCPELCNSGIYLRGRYEVAIDGNPATQGGPHDTGAIYGFLAPKRKPEQKPDQWQSLDITLIGRLVTIVHDRETVIENAEIPGPTGGARDSREELPGPILLQGDHGAVSYRNIVVTPASSRKGAR